MASGRRRIEFLRIWDLLERYLPAAPARVLDVGGGAGVYAIPLAAAGYEVHLIDPVPLPRRRPKTEVLVPPISAVRRHSGPGQTDHNPAAAQAARDAAASLLGLAGGQ